MWHSTRTPRNSHHRRKPRSDMHPHRHNPTRLNITPNTIMDLIFSTTPGINITRLLPVLKFTANEWSTGDKQHTHFQKSNECPFCHEPENMTHIFTCNHTSSISFRTKSIEGFHTQLTKIDQNSGAKWASLLHSTISNLGGRSNTTHTNTVIPPQFLDAQCTIGWFHLLQGRIHQDLWAYLRPGQGSAMGVTAIKALWKLASIFWRRRNRKKNGKSHKEKRNIFKTAIDEKISTFRNTLRHLEIPHTSVPLGYRHRVDARLAWLQWKKTSMHMWKRTTRSIYRLPLPSHRTTTTTR
jgi:hypothetical protein